MHIASCLPICTSHLWKLPKVRGSGENCLLKLASWLCSLLILEMWRLEEINNETSSLTLQEWISGIRLQV